MIGKVKNWFGIEGVKLELILPEEQSRKTQVVTGTIRLTTLQPKVVTHLRVSLIETYQRGRKQDKRIDDYTLGSIELAERLNIHPDHPEEIEFALPYEPLPSQLEALAQRNWLARAPVQIAKWARNVKSTYRIHAEAQVENTRLHPFDEKTLDW